jgi:threonine/homoserine/homoserine lactone efflux protein
VTGFLGFLLLSAAVIVAPGQDTVLTVRNTLSGKRIGGVMTALGVITGQLIWAAAATIGVSAMLLKFPEAFVALRIGGGFYLLVIGVRSVLWSRGSNNEMFGAVAHETSPPWRFAIQGLLSNLGNPKMLVFFASYLPQFANPAHPVQYIQLGLTFSGLTLAWLTLVSTAVDRMGGGSMPGRQDQFLQRIAGVVLIGLGAAAIITASS